MKEPSQAFSLSKASASNVFFINWNTPAQEISKLHRALILSNQKQPLGVLKLLIGEDIFIVRGLRVMGHRSMAPAGTILTISEKELQITTTTHNLAIYDLYSTDGLPFSITQLAAHHKLAKGYQLKSPDPEFIERFVHAASECAKHEAFWVSALANIIPCTPPLSINLKKIKKMEAEIVSFSKVDTTLFTQLLSICDKKEEMDVDNPALFTIILMYLYRLNNCQNYTLKFSNQSLYEDKATFKNFFASQLPLSVNFNPEMSFTEALEKTSVTLQQLKENKTYAKDIIFRHPELVINTEPNLVSIAVVADPKRFQLSEANALTIVINQKGTEFGLYSRKDAFPDCINTLISNLPSHLMTMMKNIAANLETPINKLCFLTDSESQKILLDWNNTKIDFPNANKPIHYFFEEQVLKTPHRTAVIFENSSLTYFELNQKANQVAQYLTNLNVSPDTLIAICAKRSLEMVIGILGILKSGCGYLPLDPNYPIERLSYMLSDSKSPILLTDTIYSNLQSDITDINCIDIKQILEQTDTASDSKVKNLVSLINLAYVIYTSGTTGKPKGVAITHRSLVNHMLWMIPKFNFTENDIFLQKTPFSFDASVWEFFAPLLCGGKLIMASNENPLEITKLIKKHKVTILQLVPSMLRQSLEENEFQTCDSLQQVFSGGEALVPDTVNLFHKKMQAKLHNLYGPTETTIEVTTYSYNRSEEQSIEAVLIGKPIDNAQVYVLDKFHNPVPVGIIGELFIGGACLARGYLNRKDLTQNRFIQNPFDEKTKLYKTGDLVRWLPDGNLEYLNRLDDQVKLHGFRIEMGEIEAALLQHELIRECAVVVQEHANNKGSLGSDKYLVAYYVKKLDLTHSDTEDFIRTWETVYQSEYSSLDINNFKQNTGGWNSSYTDKAIDQEGILEWVDATTDRIKKLKPQVILEIGSGTGLVLFNMIDNCNYYYATDFSNNVIEYTNNVIHKFGYSDKVSTITCTADDLPYTQLEKIYDTVIINSVIQYFPSLEYLETVITKTILNMKDSGQIFIGDVRDFRLLKCFHCSVQTYRREKVTKTEIDYFSSRDKELLVAPEYFIHLKAANKNISHVEILPKLGKANHEMNNYRYDVILHIRKNQEVDKEDIDGICINESNFVKMLDFENYVTSNSNNDYICIKYPNKKIAKDYIEYNKLYFNQSISNINDFDNLLTIDQMTEFAKAKNYGAKYFIDVIDPFYLYVIIYKNHTSPQKNIFIDYINRRSKSDLASKPLAILKLLENQFSNELKEFLSTKIPSYMIPGRYVPLEKLPLNINGKLDRKALTEPEFTRSESYVAPRNELEGQICRIWAEVLGLPEDKIGIQDDFFNLGGHSLSALKTLSLIKNFFLIKLPTRTLFDYPTIEKLAELIQKTQQALTITTQQSAMISPIIALQENGFKAPLFLIHPIGGTIFWYKALSRYLGTYRSIYAIQDPGIDANDLLFKNVQEMATFYLKAMQKIQPSGPYLLAGASFGATVSIEIANQLLKAGERVNFIGLLDGWPVYSKKFWEKEFFEQLMLQQFERMDLQFISQGINDFQFLLKLQQHRMSMLRDYKIPLIKSKLTFFKAEELWPVFKEMVLPLNCWQPFSTQPVDFHLVPGNHETMFWEPNVQELANKMNESFSKFEIHKQSQRLPLKIQGV